MVTIQSIRENPALAELGIAYFQSKWNSVRPEMYQDAIMHSLQAPGDLPQWYLLFKEDRIIGCVGLIPNDFISRMDLYPWLCALFVDEEERKQGYGKLLIDCVAEATKKAGFDKLYLSTEHRTYYERYDFKYIGLGHHPWGEDSRIYELEL